MEFLQAADRAALHVSVSQIKCFQMCPKLYAWRYVIGAKPEHRSANLVLGTAVHTGLAAHYLALKDGVVLADEEVVEAARQSLEEAMKQGPPVLLEDDETVADLQATAEKLVRAFLAGVERPDEVLAVEAPFYCDVVDPETGEVLEEQLTGYLDAVVRFGDAVVVLEHKTAARAWSQDQLDFDLQVGLYLAATGAARVRLQVMTKTRVPKLLVHDLVRCEREQREAVVIVCRVLQAIRAGAFWPAPGWACKTCEYRQRCRG